MCIVSVHRVGAAALGHLLLAACFCAQHGVLLKHDVLQVMADLEQHRIPLNSHIVSSFLDACKHPALTAEQCEKVFAVAAAFRATRQPDNWVYTALLNFCAEKAPEQALDVWHALEEVWAQLLGQILGVVHLPSVDRPGRPWLHLWAVDGHCCSIILWHLHWHSNDMLHKGCAWLGCSSHHQLTREPLVCRTGSA